MRRAATRAALPAALVFLSALSFPPAPAAGAPGRPLDLHVVGGGGWRAEPSFGVEWTNPPTGSGPALAAVHYRVRDPLGVPRVVGRYAWPATGISMLSVPAVPGNYVAEIWLEDASGAQGAAASATLRFDDERPARVAAPRVPAWIGRAAFPLHLSLEPPLGPAPLSGIRGYAAVLGADPGATPCLAVDRCSEAETTLRGGAPDTLTIASLPEGVTHLGLVAVSGSGMKSTQPARAALRVDTVDPVTRLAGLPTGWTNRSVTLTATASDAGAGMSRTDSGPQPFTAIALDGGTPAVAIGPSVSATVVTEGAHEVAYYARDAAGNVNDGGLSNGRPNRPPATALVRIDREPPSVVFAAAQDPADPELIRARVTDTLSGPSGTKCRIGVRRAGSGDRFEPLPTVADPAGQLRARWDSEAHPAGEYEFRAVGHDEAGNTTATTRRSDGTAMVLRNPLKLPTALSASLVASGASSVPEKGKSRTGTNRSPALRRSGTKLTVGYGARVELRGRLSGDGGGALAGQAVRVVERFAGGGGTRVSTVISGPDGGFSPTLAPGPSREVTVSFVGSATLGRADGPVLALGVRGRVRLRASKRAARVGGAPVVFRGRVIAPRGAIPTAGKSVQLQFRLPGLAWSEFRTVQTDRRGRFRYAYRFSDDDSRGVRFRFRAFAPAQDDWPYEPAGSRPVVVQGL